MLYIISSVSLYNISFEYNCSIFIPFTVSLSLNVEFTDLILILQVGAFRTAVGFSLKLSRLFVRQLALEGVCAAVSAQIMLTLCCLLSRGFCSRVNVQNYVHLWFIFVRFWSFSL